MTLFEQIIEKSTGTPIEYFYALCSTFDTFIDIDKCINMDCIVFNYEDIEKELLFTAQEKLERDYGLIKCMVKESYEEFYGSEECLDGIYLRYDRNCRAAVIDTYRLVACFDYSDLKDNWKECLREFITKINDSTTLKLMIE
jgi:hypothetical protein|nr:MAG TPA: hypothetical protein [Caudoviricetes sp.]